MFNEVIGGALARYLGLPWPEVSIGRLYAEARRDGGVHRGREIHTLCALTAYVDGLEPVPLCPALDDKEKTPRHLAKYFTREDLAPFYGKAIWDFWLRVHDTKWETLYRDPSGKPVFLDANLCLGGAGWDDVLREVGNWVPEIGGASPYCVGVLTDAAGFDPFLQRIEDLDEHAIDGLLGSIPGVWVADRSFPPVVKREIWQTRQTFVDRMRCVIEGLKWTDQM